MSFFKRLANVGKGTVRTYTHHDPEEGSRIRALQEELEADQKRGRSTRPAASAAATAAATAKSQDPQARLDALADALREGRMTREEYDLKCARLIDGIDGPPAAPTPTEPPPTPGTPRKRTL